MQKEYNDNRIRHQASSPSEDLSRWRTLYIKKRAIGEKYMSLYEIYFSPTGGTKKVADMYDQSNEKRCTRD